jgi:hypothetical protein
MVKYLLAAFLFLAAPLQAEVIKFAWDKPSTNADGSPLVISGYRFYFSSVPGSYGPAVTTLSPTATTYSWVVPANLASTKLYATITAYNAVGESERSNELVFTTQPKPAAATGLKIVP